MRVLITILLLQSLATSLIAQVQGNKKIITETYPLEHITSIDISLYAQVVIDMADSEEMTITIDENLITLVDREVIDGRLYLSQKEWINPSQDVIIKIGAPDMQMIIQGTHETTTVKNINTSQLSAMANVGKIILSGRTDIFNASAEVGEIDARNLDAPEVDVNLWSWGTIQLASPTLITGIAKGDGTVTYEGAIPKIKVRTSSGGTVKDRKALADVPEFTTKYIDIKLKNNSFKRLNAYVRGPKPDGKYFSYGFPMRPGQVKKERWTVGTKVFRKTNLGLKKLLVEIKESDEGELVELYN